MRPHMSRRRCFFGGEMPAASRFRFHPAIGETASCEMASIFRRRGGTIILALNIKGAVLPESLDVLSGYLLALIEINASAVHPQLQRLN